MLCNSRAKTAVDAYMAARAARGLRALGVAKSGDEGATWQLVGLISLLDPPREDTKRTIELAGQLGVEVCPCQYSQTTLTGMKGLMRIEKLISPYRYNALLHFVSLMYIASSTDS
jgi:hypothetical protein